MGLPPHDDHPRTAKLSRRGFLGSVGTGAIGIAISGSPGAAADTAAAPAGPAFITLRVNGREHRVAVEPRDTLLEALRGTIGLTGTKPGCERGECGACTILFDGVPRYACLTLAREAEAHEITTVEGLMDGERLGAVQQAFVEEDGYQCGFCTPGQVVAAEGLLRANPSPTQDEIRRGMSGNLCRCGAYAHIARAVRRAAEMKRKGGAS